MSKKHPALTRRSLLVAALAAPLLPVISFGQEERTLMQIRVTFQQQSFTVTLFDHASARELAAMLPMNLTISDFGGNEKITYLPRKLTELVRGPVPGAGAGDLCYYIPWGNLAFFHGSYESTHDLVRLGTIDGDMKPLRVRGEFPVRIEAV